MKSEMNMARSYLDFLVEWEILDTEQAESVLQAQNEATPPLGRLALKEGYLTQKQVFQILQDQVDDELLFGELAIKGGHLHSRELNILLEMQTQARPGLNQIILGLGLANEEPLKALYAEYSRVIRELVLQKVG